MVGSLPVKTFPVKILSKSDQNGKLSTGKLSTDKVDFIESLINCQIQLYRVVQPITVKQEWHHFAQCLK
jgi:hypothetical protein